MAIFQGLGHVALRVRDLDASVAFYTRLGFPEMLRLLDARGAPWIVYHRISEQLYLELFPGGAGPAPTDGTGLMHLCLTVEDIDRAEAELAAVGVPLMRPRNPRPGVDGNRGMWIEDPDGHQIEIMEMAPDCIQFAAVRDLRDGRPPQALSLS
jgi:catechol 2,3-dioxygenase-like lactoylglutathione lyase family enzyme